MAKNYYYIVCCWNKADQLGCGIELFNLIDKKVKEMKCVELRERTNYAGGNGGSTTWTIYCSRRRFNKLMNILNKQDRRISDVCVIR